MWQARRVWSHRPRNPPLHCVLSIRSLQAHRVSASTGSRTPVSEPRHFESSHAAARGRGKTRLLTIFLRTLDSLFSVKRRTLGSSACRRDITPAAADEDARAGGHRGLSVVHFVA